MKIGEILLLLYYYIDSMLCVLRWCYWQLSGVRFPARVYLIHPACSHIAVGEVVSATSPQNLRLRSVGLAFGRKLDWWKVGRQSKTAPRKGPLHKNVKFVKFACLRLESAWSILYCFQAEQFFIVVGIIVSQNKLDGAAGTCWPSFWSS